MHVRRVRATAELTNQVIMSVPTRCRREWMLQLGGVVRSTVVRESAAGGASEGFE